MCSSFWEVPFDNKEDILTRPGRRASKAKDLDTCLSTHDKINTIEYLISISLSQTFANRHASMSASVSNPLTYAVTLLSSIPIWTLHCLP